MIPKSRNSLNKILMSACGPTLSEITKGKNDTGKNQAIQQDKPAVYLNCGDVIQRRKQKTLEEERKKRKRTENKAYRQLQRQEQKRVRADAKTQREEKGLEWMGDGKDTSPASSSDKGTR